MRISPEFQDRFLLWMCKMKIPLQALVECTDGVCGRAEYVLINPVIDKGTHLVVKEDTSPNTEYIVPVEFVADTMSETIHLRCSKAELERMEPFIKTTYIKELLPGMNFGMVDGLSGVGSYYYLPYVSYSRTLQVAVEHQQIPPGELTVRRGTRVEAKDGYVGKVDEFVVNPENGCITHLVMREGHLWGKKDVIIPLSALGETNQDTVSLKLDKQQIEALPSFPLHRRWA
jgi:sporulation protein YlmC with PRC-barrel domain